MSSEKIFPTCNASPMPMPHCKPALTPDATNAELHKRVKELEDTVARLGEKYLRLRQQVNDLKIDKR